MVACDQGAAEDGLEGGLPDRVGDYGGVFGDCWGTVGVF